MRLSIGLVPEGGMLAVLDPALLAAYGAILGAALLLGLVVSRVRPPPAEGAVETESRRRRREEALARSPLLRLLDPLVRGLARHLRGRGSPAGRERLESLLLKAGNPYGYSAAEFRGLQGVAALLGGGLLFLLFLAQGEVSLLVPLGVGALLYWLVHANLKSRADARRMAIDRQVPYFLDLVSLTMGAGATFLQACESAVEGPVQGPLEEEVAAMLREIRAGSTVSEALGNVARRSGSDELRGLVQTVRQGEELGTPIVEIFEHQAGMNRFRRTQLGEQAAAKMPNRMALPNTLLMIAILLILFGPIIVKSMRGEML